MVFQDEISSVSSRSQAVFDDGSSVGSRGHSLHGQDEEDTISIGSRSQAEDEGVSAGGWAEEVWGGQNRNRVEKAFFSPSLLVERLK